MMMTFSRCVLAVLALHTCRGSRICCPNGFTGDDCLTAPTPCEPNPCKNGGECVPHFNTAECKCIHDYSGSWCEIEPKRCLWEEQRILQANSDPEWLPSCDNKGQYEAKQCVSSQECSAPACSNTEPVQIGFDAFERNGGLDESRHYTTVPPGAFSAAGQVRSFQLYSGAADRPLRVSIFRPTGTECEFKLVQQKEWPSFPVGLNTVDLEGDDVFQVEAGDFYGLSWTYFGVVLFDDTDTGMNYCVTVEQPQEVVVNATVSLESMVVSREYSFFMHFSESCEQAPAQCDECYCVNPETGLEKEETRTTGALKCE